MPRKPHCNLNSYYNFLGDPGADSEDEEKVEKGGGGGGNRRRKLGKGECPLFSEDVLHEFLLVCYKKGMKVTTPFLVYYHKYI